MNHDCPDIAVDRPYLVPLRTADAGPLLFCFPGSGGNVSVFIQMVASMPAGISVNAIDMDKLCEGRNNFTVEQLAIFCLQIVQGIQQHGPYYFCGYSFGGLVAFEMATRLLDQGDEVALLALLDAPNPMRLANLSSADSVQLRKIYLIDRVKKYGRNLVRGDIGAFMGDAAAYIIPRAGRFFWPLIKLTFRIINHPMPRKLRDNDPAFLKAWWAFTPRSYAKRLVLFRSESRGPEYNGDVTMGWGTCASGGIDVHIIPGGHGDMMNRPYVKDLADKLSAYLLDGVAADSRINRIGLR